MKILIAEDEKILIEIYSSFLKKAGHEVEVATDGNQTLYRMKNSKPDVVLLDLRMPKKDGFEVLEARAQDPELQEIPVIVLSGLSEDRDIKRAEALGASGFYNKVQVEVKPLLDKINDVLN